ncbi:BRO family protein [Streptomyces sp. NPDC058398]|uniref:BRO family protein n=1 Tax=Streptomyces sp. NPDC058398 TaxID=3346479 RepID=UPI003648EADF
MTTPLVFTFPETAQHVRSVMIDTEPWFVAKDVTDVLGLANGRDAVGRLPERMKSSVAISDGTPGNPNKTVIRESGVYRLIMRSNLPAAERFQDWLAEEVIPSIRQTGSYSIEPATPALPQDYEEALVALLGQVRETKALTAKVAELEPAANSWQTLAAADGDFSVADAAKILARDPAIRLGRNRLFTLLDEYRWTYRQLADDRPRVMQVAIERQWLSEIPQSHYHPRSGELVMDAPQVRVTVKGLHELHKRLGGSAAVAIPTVPMQGGQR